jgi:hypothetical protein
MVLLMGLMLIMAHRMGMNACVCIASAAQSQRRRAVVSFRDHPLVTLSCRIISYF